MKRRTGLTLVALMAIAGAAQAEGDAAKGEKVFRQCKACHAVGPGAENKVGPQLNGVVGRQTGAIEGFKYSDDFVALNAQGHVWTPEELDRFLTKPKEFASGTKMSYAGLRKETDRADVIAYLATQTGE